MKFLSVFVVLALGLVVLAGCISSSETDSLPVITIAVVEDDPGTKSLPNPQSAYAGVLEVAKHVSGFKLDVVPYKDNGDPVRAVQIANEIVNSNAVAVIGHSRVETIRAAGAVYDVAEIPVINYSPITQKLIVPYPNIFNTTYTVETEGAYIANYLRKVKSAKTATIISTSDGYSFSLAQQFKDTFQGLGGSISQESTIGQVTVDQVVSAIVSANPETENPGTIFISADELTAANIVISLKQKGVAYPIAGGSNLTTDAFLNVINERVEEKTFPGYYTNGILATRAILFDSSNRFASQFRDEYEAKFGLEPGDRVINGYDAALVLLNAIHQSNLVEQLDEKNLSRQLIFEALLGMKDTQTGTQSLVNYLYFEPSRNILRGVRFGIYQNGRLVSANTQFLPIISPSSIKDLPDQLERGKVLTVNGEYVYKANVVYAGIDLLGIDEIDIKASTYAMDFYLWLRYRPNDQDANFKPEDFVFTNLERDEERSLLRKENIPDGTILETYRVTGVFKNQFQFHDYPFDHQNLAVELRNLDANTNVVQYVVDQVGMQYRSEDQLLANYRKNGAFDSIYGWGPRAVAISQDTFPTFSTLGNPANFDDKLATNYSLINLTIDVQRDSLDYIFKSLLPLMITLILAYITFYLPLGHSERFGVGSAGLLATALFHLNLADSLPEIGYTVAMEYLFYASYLMSALIVLLETISIRYESLGQKTKSKLIKKNLESKRRNLNLVGRIIYPLILFAVFTAGYFVYIGELNLGTRELASNTLVDVIQASKVSTVSLVEDDHSQNAPGDEIHLSLITWRPEDERQLQVVLDTFHEYAMETHGQNIVIDHNPVVSVNYDSILDLQLSGGEGPDLVYVRPFSVNGYISKYLLPLNDLISMQDKFGDTKTTPWTDRAGVYYAEPFVGVVQGVYYNKDLFAKYGLTVPATWEDFLFNLALIRAQDPSMIPIANALNMSEDSEMFMSIAANFLGGPKGRRALMTPDGASLCFTSDRVVSAFKAIEDIKPYLPPDAGTIGSQQSKELFFDQKAVMLFGGSWDLLKVSDESVFSWGVFAVPAPRGMDTYVIFQPDIGIGINKNSDHINEAQLFLNWLATNEKAVSVTASSLVGFYPLNSNIKAKGASSISDQKFLDLVNNYDIDIRWMFVEISDKVPRADKIIIRDLNAIIASGLTPEEAAEDLQSGLGEWYEPAQNCVDQ